MSNFDIRFLLTIVIKKDNINIYFFNYFIFYSFYLFTYYFIFLKNFQYIINNIYLGGDF